MKAFVVLLVAVATLPIRASAMSPDQATLIDQKLEPPVVQIDLIPRRPPPTATFLLEQGLVSVGIQGFFAGATAAIIAIVANHLSASSSPATNTVVLLAVSVPTTLGYIFVPSLVLTRMAGRRTSSVYFQKVFWAAGIASSVWTLALIATDTLQGGSIPLAIGFGITGVLLTAALQVWMGYMDWDTDPPDPPATASTLSTPPPTRAAAEYSAPAMPAPASVSLISWRF